MIDKKNFSHFTNFFKNTFIFLILIFYISFNKTLLFLIPIINKMADNISNSSSDNTEEFFDPTVCIK